MALSLATITPNWGLMKNPLNYITILLMLVIFSFAIDAAVTATGKLRASGAVHLFPPNAGN